ncbi:diacylglycerol kinase [Pseudorhodobacter sp.]|uniref:diacylglycerol kinase n=1 Tax=Pseudorhodobacter sp. TaxID=1934400 RepID=UPI002648370D|nr:diacylglycerol kinase [Pseudorhodobacter sp.]MDN5788134.1 diacylglycerol kinase [Pseudorhodobacter sp.]
MADKNEAFAKPRPARITGLRHLLAAAGYSVAGIRRLWAETAFRHEVLGLPIVALLFWLTSAPVWAYPGFLILWFLLLAIEALNTAVEAIVDHVSPHWSEAARDAKDLGSLAVMALLFANGVFVAVVLFCL